MLHAFLFDIGNVLLKFDFTIALRKLAAQSDVRDELDALERIEQIKAPYEAGEIDRAAFLRGAFDVLGYRGTEAEFIAAWEDIFELNEPMAALVEQLAPRFPLYLLSNTNDIHHACFTRRYPVFAHFRGGTFSHVVRASKPGREIYDVACRDHGLQPATTFFIDDLLPNIETARALGFITHHYHPAQHDALLAQLREQLPRSSAVGGRHRMKTRLALLLAMFTSFAFAQAPQLRLPEGVKAHRDIAYVEGGHERQKLDLFLPAKADGPLPVVIWVHGGGWQNGSKENCPPLRGGYLERGYAVASLGYRLSQHAVFPAQIEDCKAAIRWLRAHAKDYGLDAQRFGVWGGSAGGHLVALIGTSGGVKEFEVGANLDQSSRVQAVCDWFGPTDFSVFVTTPGYEKHAAADSAEAKLIGGAVMENKEKAARVNPIAFVSEDDPAFLIMHGDKDPVVAINQSALLFEALKKAGVSAHFHTIHGAGHGGPGFAGKNIDGMVSGFFDARLKGSHSALSSWPKGGAKIEALTSESTADVSAPGAPRRGPAWEAVLGRSDKNKDGKVSKDEFSGPAAIFQRLDRDGDGVLTREEHEAAGR